MLKKTTQLKQMLQSDQLEVIMEAHDGLARKLLRRPDSRGSGEAG